MKFKVGDKVKVYKDTQSSIPKEFINKEATVVERNDGLIGGKLTHYYLQYENPLDYWYANEVDMVLCSKLDKVLE